MKNLLRYMAITFLLASFVAFASPDNKKEAVQWCKAVNESMKKAPAMSFEITYAVFKGHNSHIAHESKTAYVKRKGAASYIQRIEGTETIQNDELMIIKDDSSKVILIKKPVGVNHLESLLNVEKAIAAASTVNQAADGEKTVTYTMTFDPKKHMDFNRIELVFDQRSKMFEKITIWYLTKINFSNNPGVKDDFVSPRVEMQFEHVKTNIELGDEVFSSKNYLQKTKTGWQPKPAFKEYQFIDQTNN